MICPKCGKNSVIRKDYTAHGYKKTVWICITPGCKTRSYAVNQKGL